MLSDFPIRTMDISYSLIRSKKRKKTLSLQIGGNSEITVYAPYATPAREIHQFVEAKRDWIDRAMRRQAAMPASLPSRSFVTGEQFYYLGKSYPLETFFEPLENAGVVFWNDRFFLNCQENTEMKKALFCILVQEESAAIFEREG